MERDLTDPKTPGGNPRNPAPRRKPAGAKPAWTQNLRKLYDDVVAEPLPDSFEDLLNKLDKAADD